MSVCILHKQYKIYEALCSPFKCANPDKYGIFLLLLSSLPQALKLICILGGHF